MTAADLVGDFAVTIFTFLLLEDTGFKILKLYLKQILSYIEYLT
jgi:hypothetical protein